MINKELRYLLDMLERLSAYEALESAGYIMDIEHHIKTFKENYNGEDKVENKDIRDEIENRCWMYINRHEL